MSSKDVSLATHLGAMCAWAETLANLQGWTKGNAASFYAARDAARAASETASPQAPIACLTIGDQGEIANIKQYAPGLPPGEHELYCEPLETPAMRCVLPVITVQMLGDFGQEGFFEKTDEPVRGVSSVTWSQAAVDFACLIQRPAPKAKVQHAVTCKMFPDPYDEREPAGPCTCGALKADETRPKLFVPPSHPLAGHPDVMVTPLLPEGCGIPEYAQCYEQPVKTSGGNKIYHTPEELAVLQRFAVEALAPEDRLPVKTACEECDGRGVVSAGDGSYRPCPFCRPVPRTSAPVWDCACNNPDCAYCGPRLQSSENEA